MRILPFQAGDCTTCSASLSYRGILHGVEDGPLLPWTSSSTAALSVVEEAMEKLRRGILIMAREGTVAENLATLIPLVRRAHVWEVAMCSDDRHPIDLWEEGHLDHHLRKAVPLGVDPLIALRAVTYTPARHDGLADGQEALQLGS